MARAEEIKVQMRDMELMYDNLFSVSSLAAQYDALRNEHDALERGEVYIPVVPDYALGNLQSARSAIHGWIEFARNSRNGVNYAWGMTAEQHDYNLAVACRNIARQWSWYRAALQQYQAS